MKKLIVTGFLLLALLMFIGLSACGNPKEKDNTPDCCTPPEDCCSEIADCCGG